MIRIWKMYKIRFNQVNSSITIKRISFIAIAVFCKWNVRHTHTHTQYTQSIIDSMVWESELVDMMANVIKRSLHFTLSCSKKVYHYIIIVHDDGQTTTIATNSVEKILSFQTTEYMSLHWIVLQIVNIWRSTRMPYVCVCVCVMWCI